MNTMELLRQSIAVKAEEQLKEELIDLLVDLKGTAQNEEIWAVGALVQGDTNAVVQHTENNILYEEMAIKLEELLENFE